MKENIKAFLIGAIVIATVSWLSLWTMDTLEIGYLGWLSWTSPLIGAFITAVIAQTRKMMTATLLAVPAAIIFGIENYLWQLLGKGSDFPGYKGFITLVVLEFITAIILCSIGGLLGWLVSHKKTNIAH